MVRLSKDNANFQYIKDSYAITKTEVDANNSRLSVELVHYYHDESGNVKTEKLRTYLTNESGAKIVDPNWTSQSDPAKPDGFVLEDPETWGGLMWEDIPLVDDTSKYYFDMVRNAAPDVSRSEWSPMDQFGAEILEVLGSRGDIPTVADGWAISVVS